MPEERSPDKPVVFGAKELDPEEEAAYRRKIAESRANGGVGALKSREPVGTVPKPTMPDFSAAPAKLAPSGFSPDGGVQPRPPGSPLLSPQTAQQLQDLAEAQVRQAEGGKAAESAKEDEKKNEDVEKLFDSFDFAGRNEAERVLNNKTRRTAIEARCAQMDIEDLIMKDEVQQVVPIISGKFEVTYRSMTPDENLYIKRYVAKNDTGQSDQYVLEKFGLCQLVCTVLALNGRLIPDHRKADGSVDDALFDAKLKFLLKKSAYIIADLGINYAWFDIRVRRLLNPDSLGNG